MRAIAIAASPARKATVRRRGTGFPGWAVSTRRTAHSHAPAAPSSGRTTNGSNDQPNRSPPSDGGSAGAGPWPAAGPAAASQPDTAAVAHAARAVQGAPRRGFTRVSTGSSSHARAVPAATCFGSVLGYDWPHVRATVWTVIVWPTTHSWTRHRSPSRSPSFAVRGQFMSSSPGTRPSIGSLLAGIIAVAALAAFVLWLVLNGEKVVRSFFPPDAVTAQGREIGTLYTIVFLIAAVVFFVVEALIIWSVIRYRRKPGDDELPPQTHGHNLAEVVWTLIPTIIVTF